MPDTYTSQFSGEEIDSALRAAQIISGASTLAELREKLEIRGDNIPVSAEDSTLISEALTKIPTTSGGGVNPNLLDNWYFGNPVNQRGQTEYTGGGYTVDRWKLSQWNTDEVAAKLKKTGLNISGSAEGKANSTYIEENIDLIEKWQELYKTLDKRANFKLVSYNCLERGRGAKIVGLLFRQLFRK